MKNLRVYKTMPIWNAETLPAGFRKKHNTKDGTWARLTVHAGALRFTYLSDEGAVLSAEVIDASSGPQLVEPGAWHHVEPLGEALRCQLEFLCEPHRYLEKKHHLTAPHSEVRALLPALQGAPGRTVLDLGSGRGRNSFYLAQHGFTVTAVDRSEGAIGTLSEIAAAEELDVSSAVYDINLAAVAGVLPGGTVDHIISTVVFQFLRADRVAAVIEDMQVATRIGGLHLIVAPLTSNEVPCPIDFPFAFQRNELAEYYREWDVLRYDETLGEFHRRDENGQRYQAEFGRIVARKPG